MIHDDITQLIGNTPLLRLPERAHGLPGIAVHAKLELLNPLGSVKDRTAWAMLRPHLDDLRSGGRTVVESSSSNTAKALQVLAGMHGIGFRTVTNRIEVEESRDLLRLLGAQIQELPGTSDCHDPSDPNDPVLLIERQVAVSAGALHHTSQYTNPANVAAHHATGEEILAELPRVDYFVSGLGTTGSTRGITERLRAANPDLTVIGVVAHPADFIPGIRTADEMYEVGLYQPQLYDAVVTVTSAEAIEATMRLIRTAGLLAGPTTGAALAGLGAYLQGLTQGRDRGRDAEPGPGTRSPDPPVGPPATAVLLACDRIENYLSYLRTRRPDLFDLPVPSASVRTTEVTSPEVYLAPASAATWIAEEPTVVIDTRGSLAYATGHVPGAINLTDHALETLLDDGIPFPDRSRLLIACAVGARSARYASFLRAHGRHARSLDGGMAAWRDAGLPLERSTLPQP
jgi:cysteine synthase/rhodanese-related sulfurtransferase